MSEKGKVSLSALCTNYVACISYISLINFVHVLAFAVVEKVGENLGFRVFLLLDEISHRFEYLHFNVNYVVTRQFTFE